MTAEVGYETLSHPLDPTPQRSLWVTTEVGTIHRACGTEQQCEALGARHIAARVASGYEVGDCCRSENIACAFDMFGEDHDIDQVVMLAWALVRAEGRDTFLDPPHRCPVHQVLTFGGCCDGYARGEGGSNG